MAGDQPTPKAFGAVTITAIGPGTGVAWAALMLAAIPVPHTIWTQWNLDPILLLAILAAAVVYLRGFARVSQWHRYPSGTVRGRAIAYLAGTLTLIVALISPLDRLTAAVLWAHMTQYMVLTVIASLLLVVARPASVLRRGLPPAWARAARHWVRSARVGRAIRTGFTNAYVIAAVDIGTLIFWHIPIIYQAAVRYEALHLLEVASFLVSGLLFWWAVRNPAASPALGYGRVLGCFAITSLASLAVGLVLFSSRSVLYPIYLDRTAPWGISPHGDQQLAGVILGITPELFDVLTFIVILARWVQSEGSRL